MYVNLIIPPQPELHQPTAYIPLGLAYIGAVLEQGGHEVTVTDLNTSSKIEDAEIYGITAVTAMYKEAKKIALKLRGRTVVMGGIHPSIFPKEVLQDTGCTHVVVGEGEYAFRDIVNGVEKDKIIQGGYVENLDTLPFPARHLFSNVVDYSGIHGQERGEGATTIISSRGCPFHCSFCTKIPQTSTVRFRQPDKILLEMKTVMDDYDVTHFRFVDDIFTLDSKRVEKFCELKSSEGNGATWICITRADALNTHLLKQMKGAGCREIHIGVESGSQRILDAMNKQTTVKTLRDAVTDIKKTGIRVKTYIMYGYPGETEKDREETIRFIREVKPDKVTVSEFTPIPGSLLWDECSTSDNWFYSDDNDEYNDFRRRCTELCE